MIKNTKKLIVGALAAALMVTSFVPADIQAKKKDWTSELKVDIPQEIFEKNGYGRTIPALDETADKNLKRASSVPSAYMNSVAQLNEKYPAPRDQGNYETCWAFSSIGLAEFDMIIDGIADKTNADLSELQHIYYSYHNVEDAFGGTYGDKLSVSGDYRQFGGNLYFASRTLLQWEGVMEETGLPYSQIGSTSFLGKEYAFSKNVAHLQDAYVINIHKNPDSVKKEIMKHGAAGIGYYAGGDNFTRGVYDTTAVYNGETVSTFYCPVVKDPNHAVNIVGWDDNFPASNFSNRPSGNGAWLVRNSWTNVASNELYSYFWLSYYDKSLEDEAWIYDMEPADNYDYNYQYDGCPVTAGKVLEEASTHKVICFPTSANVFKVQGAGNELLEAVSIAMTDYTNVPYTIKVYTNLASPSKPRSGVLAAKVSGKTTYAGTYTIPLKTAVSMPKGTYYSIVVELGKKKSSLDIEIAGSGNGFTSKAYVDYNQSLIYYKGAWEDLADLDSYGLGNLCIKGFTSKTGTTLGKVENLRAKSTTKNSTKLSWSGVEGADGYVVYRATSKNGRYYKVTTTGKKSYTNKKLKSGKTYYYKVRAYKKVNNVTVYGKLSSKVTVKTKK